ncbi:bifunctional helix-turn-helix transcriptional regulator/GNAT family N-acetyltransferase [Phytohabitans aurantiacus]|jgi:DNA-binding MarR family transcriptional regulator/GNAT superfamily N-acetyltransferase|uniref:MarR family transcriptional regulator n=1 Tax=Phytohabitans aurantiacus TaxID=3016789 RepID=A0ABQ5QUD2_9ACTN|nr:helix-turn-helix domain-containing GNAT family N-acetyltransferase [Phytohabitans aurantiacus]GLH97847.1 MarR family transcriptional regulator [Phytohabitans aurantiacus]
MSDRVAEIRAFNRFYTRVIGVLGEGMLSTPYTLTEARVLFELAHRDSVEVVDLRRALDLDAGYLSRILARFESDGMITRSRSAVDARRQVIELTEAGRATQAELDKRTDVQIGELVSGLGEADQRRLLGAMATIQDLLGEPTRRDLVVLRPPTPGDLGWIVQRHGAIYAREFGWDASFEALVARIVADYAADHDPRREAVWIAEVDGAPAGCVMCVRRDDKTAQLRLLLVEPSARGMGVGGRLVEECLRFAKRTGYERIMLWTYDATKDAHRIYERAGFTLDEQREATAFGFKMVDEIWSRDL